MNASQRIAEQVAVHVCSKCSANQRWQLKLEQLLRGLVDAALGEQPHDIVLWRQPCDPVGAWCRCRP
jgi:hypothetical protein